LPETPQPCITCIKMAFPLPNGNAILVLRPVVLPDGSLQPDSSERRFDDPGFYFTVHDANGTIWAKYVATFHELIHVHEAKDGYLRTDHVFNLWGSKLLYLHHRINRVPQPVQTQIRVLNDTFSLQEHRIWYVVIEDTIVSHPTHEKPVSRFTPRDRSLSSGFRPRRKYRTRR
jgi:hypothetical protein